MSCANCSSEEQPIHQVNITALNADFWRDLAGNQPDGVNDHTEAITHLGDVAIGSLAPAAKLDVNGSVVFRQLSLTDRLVNAPLGMVAVTVDSNSTIAVNQITAGVTVTLPAPTNSQAGRLLYVENTGTQSLTVDTTPIPAGKMSIFSWSGTAWIPISASGGGGGPVTMEDFWRSGTAANLLLPDGATDYTDVISHNANTGIGLNDPSTVSARLDVAGAEVLRPVTLPNFAANGAIGASAATVDIASTITINQTTGNIALTIPNPTNAQQGRVLNISNIGTAQVRVGNQYITPKTGQSFVWVGGQWIPLGDNPEVITVAASRNLAPTDHLKTLLATGPVTLTCPVNIGYLLLRVRQQTAAAVVTIAAGAGVTLVAPFGASTIGLAGASLVVECFGNRLYVE